MSVALEIPGKAGARREIALALLRALLGAVFVWAGAVKAGDPAGFARDIAAYRLLGPGAVPLLAAWLPYLELVAGVALIAGVAWRGAVRLALGLTMVFVAALASAWIRGLDISCGCFGGGGKGPMAILEALARDGVLLASAVALLRRQTPREPAGARG